MELFGIGECMIELYQDGGAYRVSYGGDVMNTLVASSRLDISCGFMSRIGKDGFYDELMEAWRTEGIDLSYLEVDLKRQNGLYLIRLDSEGERKFQYYRKGSAASALRPEILSKIDWREIKFLHVSGISLAISSTARETVIQAVKLAFQNGVKVSYDPNVRMELYEKEEEAKEALEEILPYLNILLLSGPLESKNLLGMERPEEILQWIGEKKILNAAIKWGRQGVYIKEGEREEKIDGKEVEARDTTAAGDAFNGGVLAGLIRGESFSKAARIGIQMASETIEKLGSIRSIPSRDRAKEFWKENV